MIFAVQRPLDGNFELKARKTGESLTRIRGGPIFVVFMGSFLQQTKTILKGFIFLFKLKTDTSTNKQKKSQSTKIGPHELK